MFCADADGDLYQNCEDDCDDFDDGQYPGAPQLCDGRNPDCDDAGWPEVPPDETDDDGDGWVECKPWDGPLGPVVGGDDCDDTDPSIHPGAVEVNDGADNQCPGFDGYGLVDETSGESGFHDPSNRHEYSWPAQAGATQYEVARSLLADFSADCVTAVVTEPVWIDAVDPAVGDTFHYLNRPLAPFPGSWGEDSNAVERTVVCP